MSTTISKKKLKELMEIQKKYKALQKMAKTNKKVKTVLDTNEQKQKLDTAISNMKRQTTRINNQITKVNQHFKQALPDFQQFDSAYKNTIEIKMFSLLQETLWSIYLNHSTKQVMKTEEFLKQSSTTSTSTPMSPSQSWTRGLQSYLTIFKSKG